MRKKRKGFQVVNLQMDEDELKWRLESALEKARAAHEHSIEELKRELDLRACRAVEHFDARLARCYRVFVVLQKRV